MMDDDTMDFWKNAVLGEVVDELENAVDGAILPAPFYLLPPDKDDQPTDEDCEDEDEMFPANVKGLASTMMNTKVDFGFEDVEFDVDKGSVEESDHTGSDHKRVRLGSKTKLLQQWNVGHLDDTVKTKLESFTEILPNLPLTAASEPVEYFKLFFTEQIMQQLVHFTNLYSSQNKDIPLNANINEMYALIGILIISGYVRIPHRKYYWPRPDLSNMLVNIMISNTMTNDRFDQIFESLHFADNTKLPENDKLGKLRPLVDVMNKNFLKFAPLQNGLSIDELLIPYFGHHDCLQFRRNKPLHFGFKSWILAQANGYCLQFDIHQGKDSTNPLPICESVIMKFAHILKENHENLKFSLFFEEIFTNPTVISNLSSMGYGGTGKFRNRRCGNATLNSITKNSQKGEYASVIDKQTGIVAVRWREDRVTTIMSNEFGVNPQKTCVRYSSAGKKNINIPQPLIAHMFEKYMGGVQLFENHLEKYRIGIYGKKWYMPIVLWILDAAICNAWVLAKSMGCQMGQLKFRRKISMALCNKYGSPPTP